MHVNEKATQTTLECKHKIHSAKRHVLRYMLKVDTVGPETQLRCGGLALSARLNASQRDPHL